MSNFAPILLVAGYFLTFGPLTSRRSTWGRTLLILPCAYLSTRYLQWRWTETLPGFRWEAAIVWMWIIFAIEFLAYCSLATLLLILCRRADRSAEAEDHERRLRALPAEELPSVDLLIPTYNEDFEVLRRTLVAAKSIDYPRLTVFVLDDGKRDWLRSYCEEHDIRYVRRTSNEHGKAGNLNHGLQFATSDLVAVLDADFVALPNFLYRTAGFFADPRIGVVQTPQHFFNADPIQHNLKLSDAWVDEQRFPFEDVLPSRDAWDCAYCCGSCAVLRRSAIDEIGGFPTESVTEDVLTTMVMLRHGYVTRYLNEKLSHGLAPESLNAFFVQRRRWCRGSLQILFLRDGPLAPGLTLLQRLFFLPVGLDWIVRCLVRFLVLSVPLAVIFLGLQPYEGVSVDSFVLMQLPVWLSLKCAMSALAPGRHLPGLTTATWLLVAVRIVPVVVATLLKPFGEPFRVTPKGRANVLSSDSLVITTLLGLIAVNAAAIVVSAVPGWNRIEAGLSGAAGLFCFYNIVLLFVAVLMAVQLPQRRADERFQCADQVRLIEVSRERMATLQDVSLGGARIGSLSVLSPECGLELPDVGVVRLVTVWSDATTHGVRFEGMTAIQTESLSRWIYGGRFDNSLRSGKPTLIVARLIRRILFAC
jgi:cellulose synthase (UDP-forming)